MAASPYFADLHCHSVFSDGTARPSVVARGARDSGVAVLALTDHDTVAGWTEFRAAAIECGLDPIPGIEISATCGREVHILGYFFDPSHMRLAAYCASRAQARIDRVRKIAGRLAAHNRPIDVDAVIASAGGHVGRPHVARALVAAGYVRTMEEAFRRWLGDTGPAFVDYERIDARDAIALIREAGGVSSLAHPGLTRIDDARISELARAGLGGLEAYHADHTRDDARRFVEQAARLGLFVTGGSDHHGNEGRRARELGAAGLTRQAYQTVVSRATGP